MLKLDVFVVVTSGLQWNCWSCSYVGVALYNLSPDSQYSCKNEGNKLLRKLV
jgi:hypothetical protein